MWAYSMSRWTGAGANNDTSDIGFDAFTKTMRTQGYRIRQSSETRAGQFGNEYNLGVMKGLTVDLFNAIRVEPIPGEKEHRMTPFEIMTRQSQIDTEVRRILHGRKLEGEDVSSEEREHVAGLQKEKDDLWKMMRFRQFTQASYSSNHLNRAFTVFHSLMGAEELRLEEVVKWDPIRGLVYDRGKFETMVKENFLKPMRYAFSTYPGIDFGKETRVQTGRTKEGIPIYKSVTRAEKMFGPEVLFDIKQKSYHTYKKYMSPEEQKTYIKGGHLTEEGKHIAFSRFVSDENSDGGRPMIWKNAARARITKELLAHREFGNGYTYFNHMMADKFVQALESIKAVEILGEDDEETHMQYGKTFFTHEDIAWIKNHSKLKRIDIIRELGKDVGYGIGKGVLEGVGEFFNHVFK